VNLKNKIALITGASRGVGAATALQLAQAGCRVAINHRQTADRAEAVATQCREAGAEAIVIQGDVAEDSACRAMVQKTIEAFGGLDILVNNAGTTRFINFPDLDEVRDEDWDRIFAVNLKGPFQTTRAAREALAAGEGGVIVNTASIAGLVGAGSSIPYCASKAALIVMTKSLARTLGPAIHQRRRPRLHRRRMAPGRPRRQLRKRQTSPRPKHHPRCRQHPRRYRRRNPRHDHRPQNHRPHPRHRRRRHPRPAHRRWHVKPTPCVRSFFVVYWGQTPCRII
jgi:NADP-dependent 3-hydroxy acid dehydrogenase YdfG